MNGAVDEIRLTFAAEGGNSEPYLGEGWREAEAGRRWTDGLRSLVRLPPVRSQAWFVLTLDAVANGAGPLPVIVRLNGVEVVRYQHSAIPYDVVAAGDLVNAETENLLEFDLSEMAPSTQAASHGPALAFRQLILAPLDTPLHATPLALPEVAAPPDWWEARTVSEAFQSLGRNCDLGLFQRRYRAEPFGLLRFAAISPECLILGLKTRFAGVGDVGALSFYLTEDGGQWDGKHAVYGLFYHTFKLATEADVETLAVKEAARLDYLARLLFEQLENNEKIFVRARDFESPGEALALHRLLQTFNAQARLLLLQAAPANAPERVGRVYEMRPGLYIGYLSRLSDLPGAQDRQTHEEWLRLCATVVAYERARMEVDDKAPQPRDPLTSKAAAPPLADDLRLIFAREGQNVESCLGEGWSDSEPEFRWTEGASSVLRLPAMRARPWFALSFDAHPVGGVPQPITVRLNGAEAARYAHRTLVPFDIAIPGDLVNADAWNQLVIEHPLTTRPSEADPGSLDTRLLALAFRGLTLDTLDAPLHMAPRLLPAVATPTDPAEAKAVCEAFQSLGQHCDLGLLQRHYGTEPFGLLRFASILPHELIRGLKTRFAGVGDVGALKFYLTEDGSQWDGRHDVYGLNYHTFKLSADIDAATLAVKEAARLEYLARLLFEQLDNNEKIFAREGSFEAPGEALALHRLLRTFNPQARLLLLQPAPAHMPERIGRVIELRAGLYRGYLSGPSDIARSRRPQMFGEWLKLCATVVAYEAARPVSA